MEHLIGNPEIMWERHGDDTVLAIPLGADATALVDMVIDAAEGIGASVAGVWVATTFILTTRGGSHVVTVPYRGDTIPVGPALA
jgi:hypothetical protein